MSSIAQLTQHIEMTPGVCGGKPRIAGHRIKVQDIVIKQLQGDRPSLIEKIT